MTLRSIVDVRFLVLGIVLVISQVNGQFVVPQADVKLLSPRGFEVSIPGKSR